MPDILTEREVEAIIHTSEKITKAFCRNYLNNDNFVSQGLISSVEIGISVALDILREEDLKSLGMTELIDRCNTASRASIKELAQALNTLADNLEI